MPVVLCLALGPGEPHISVSVVFLFRSYSGNHAGETWSLSSLILLGNSSLLPAYNLSIPSSAVIHEPWEQEVVDLTVGARLCNSAF